MSNLIKIIVPLLLVVMSCGPRQTSSDRLVSLAHSGIREDIYKLIADHRPATIAEKNAIISEVRDAIARNPNDLAKRTAEIRQAVKQNGNYTELANRIIVEVDRLHPIYTKLALMARPTAMPRDVYDAIANHGGNGREIAAKNRVISAIDAALTGPVNARDAAIRAAIAQEPKLAGLDTTIINLLPSILLLKPPTMPQDVYDAIVNHAGVSNEVAAKNRVIPTIDAALVGPIAARNAAIQAAIAGEAALAGVDAAIIALLIVEKPATMPQDVYDAIVNHGGAGSEIAAKNRVIPTIAAAIVGPIAARNAVIQAAIAGEATLVGLDATVIALLIVEKPATMPQDVYDAIVNHGGAGAEIAAKNRVIPAIDAAINGPAAARNAAIAAAVAGEGTLAGLDAAIFALLVDEKPAAMPQDVYDDIVNHGGADNFIAAKNAILPGIVAAITGHINARDVAIRNVVAAHVDLAGLDATIIGRLPAANVPPKPAGMDDALYNAAILLPDMARLFGFQNNVLNLLQGALGAQPNFGLDRDNQVRNEILRLILPLTAPFHAAIRAVADEAVRIVNIYLPQPTPLHATGLSQALYQLVVGAGLHPREANQILLDLGVVASEPDKPTRDAAVDATMAANGGNAALGLQLKAELDNSQILRNRPPALEQATYDAIIAQMGLSISTKNAIIDGVADAMGIADYNARDTRIRAVVLANNGGTEELARALIRTTPLASNIEGVLLNVAGGSSNNMTPEGNPTWFVVRVTRSNDAARAPVGARLYLHPDRYQGQRVTYGDRVFFDGVSNAQAVDDPRGAFAPRLRLIQRVVGFR